MDANVGFTNHANEQMLERFINIPMVMEALRMGSIYMTPEPDIRFSGLKCRMERCVSGMNVAVQYPQPDLTVITVIEVKKV